MSGSSGRRLTQTSTSKRERSTRFAISVATSSAPPRASCGISTVTAIRRWSRAAHAGRSRISRHRPVFHSPIATSSAGGDRRAPRSPAASTTATPGEREAVEARARHGRAREAGRDSARARDSERSPRHLDVGAPVEQAVRERVVRERDARPDRRPDRAEPLDEDEVEDGVDDERDDRDAPARMGDAEEVEPRRDERRDAQQQDVGRERGEDPAGRREVRVEQRVDEVVGDERGHDRERRVHRGERADAAREELVGEAPVGIAQARRDRLADRRREQREPGGQLPGDVVEADRATALERLEHDLVDRLEARGTRGR